MLGKENKIKVSVIVPVCNVEKYLDECLESIISQTLKNIEIICINDGSTDNSLKIIKKYANLDSRIKVIDKENSGYGNSMNKGLELAIGEYIGIVESDDFIDKHMFKSLYELTYGGTADVVKGNFYDFYDNNYAMDNKEDTLFGTVVNMDRDHVKELDKPFKLQDNPEISWGHPSVWSAIYRREFLIENNIRFMEEKGGGWVDNPFFYETLCKADSIVWTKKPFYYYRKTNPNSSSNSVSDPALPFKRMIDNLNVINECGYGNDVGVLKCAYARALMYLRGAIDISKSRKEDKIILEYAKQMLEKLNPDILLKYFNDEDQATYYKYSSPLASYKLNSSRILIYNWLPFDNQWNWGGGVTVYCKNIIEYFVNNHPDLEIYFLSSGFAYSANIDKTYYRKIGNIFGERVHQYEIVNSPIPAEQRNLYVNPLVALENESLKKVFAEFIDRFGPFEAIHFNNIEGLSLDILDLKEQYSNTKFIFSIHNYVPLCVNGSYYMRHKHCNCNPEHTGMDCFLCTRADIRKDLADSTYERGLYGIEPKQCMSRSRWIKKFGFERLDCDVSPEEILDFAKTATEKINKNCDSILAVSKRVYDIAAENGFDREKMTVSYIGTKVAECQIGHATAKVENGLKV